MKRRLWIGMVATRWFLGKKASGGNWGSVFAAGGIAAGVAALIVVLAVMNGFQGGYIDSLLEVSSFHARIELREGKDSRDLASRLAAVPGVKSVLPFRETQVLISLPSGRAVPLSLRRVPRNAASLDPGFARQLGLPSKPGEDFFPEAPGLVIGSELARYLGLEPGDLVELTAVRSSAAEGVETLGFSIRVAATFKSGFYEFDSGLGLVADDELSGLFSDEGRMPLILGVKLQDRNRDIDFLEKARALEPEDFWVSNGIELWRDYNRAFFGALRTEKAIMMVLIGLIFLVVGVNIFQAMRRTVAERMADIAILRTMGAGTGDIQAAFMLDGLAIGGMGALLGLVLGLLIAVNVNQVFSLVETSVKLFYRLLFLLGRGEGADFRVFSPRYFYLVEVPVRVLFPEVLFIVCSAALSAVAAAGAAANRVSALVPAEVLRYE